MSLLAFSNRSVLLLPRVRDGLSDKGRDVFSRIQIEVFDSALALLVSA